MKRINKLKNRLLREYLFFRQRLFLMRFTPENSSRYIQDELEKNKLDCNFIINRQD
jgi:hypothetical protein